MMKGQKGMPMTAVMIIMMVMMTAVIMAVMEEVFTITAVEKGIKGQKKSAIWNEIFSR